MITLNEEQQKAYDSIAEFIRDGHTVTQWITLSGKAGTGKTLILSKLVEAFPNRIFTISAIAHKAKEELQSRITSNNVVATTVASLLGMKMNVETGEFKEDPYAEEVPISGVDVLFVDEASMIHKDILDMIMERKPGWAAVIFAGDEGQIRPIKKYSKIDELSPVFKGKNLLRLTTRVRQGEGNPILPASDYWWDATKAKRAIFSNLQRPNVITEKGSIIYTGDMKKVIAYYKDAFLEAKQTGNPYKIKIVTYTNKVRQKINSIVREMIFGRTADELEVGELMMMTNNFRSPFDGFGQFYGIPEALSSISNSREFAVVQAIERKVTIEDVSYNYYYVKGVYKVNSIETYCTLPILAKSDVDKWKDFVNKKFEAAKELRGIERMNAFSIAREYADNTFAPVDYGYCITAHRAQGSTYEISIVNLTDMLKAPINHQEVASLIYTGMTRASNTAVMVNKEFTYTLKDEPEPDYETLV